MLSVCPSSENTMEWNLCHGHVNENTWPWEVDQRSGSGARAATMRILWNDKSAQTYGFIAANFLQSWHRRITVCCWYFLVSIHNVGYKGKKSNFTGSSRRRCVTRGDRVRGSLRPSSFTVNLKLHRQGVALPSTQPSIQPYH